jgi:hypothetical protein
VQDAESAVDTPEVKAARDSATAEWLGGVATVYAPGEVDSVGTDPNKWTVWSVTDAGRGGRGDFDTEAEATAFADRTNMLSELTRGEGPYFDKSPEELQAEFDRLNAKFKDVKGDWGTLSTFAPEDREEAGKLRGLSVLGYREQSPSVSNSSDDWGS